MANLVLVCRRCNHEAEAKPGEWAREGICTDCGLKEALEPYRVEMIRLWRKYSHYVAKGISVANQDHQLQNKFRRGLRKALDSVPGVDPKRVEELATRLLITDAQSAAAGYQRIARA